MGLINVLSSGFASLALGIAGNIFSNDLCARVPKFCERIIRRAAQRLHEPDRARYLEEWLADLAERDGGLAKIKHSVGVLRSAKRMMMQAQKVELVINVPFRRQIVSTGFKANGFLARFTFWAYRGPNTPIKYPFRKICAIYIASKFVLRARNSLSKAMFSEFCHSKWISQDNNTVVLSFRGVKLEVTEIWNACKNDPANGPALVAAWSERLKKAASEGRFKSAQS